VKIDVWHIRYIFDSILWRLFFDRTLSKKAENYRKANNVILRKAMPCCKCAHKKKGYRFGHWIFMCGKMLENNLSLNDARVGLLESCDYWEREN
jgi:hypothetical protein